jgi:hypothetical protein
MENNKAFQARLGLGGKTRMQADLVAAMTGNLTQPAKLIDAVYGTAFRMVGLSGGMRRRHGQRSDPRPTAIERMLLKKSCGETMKRNLSRYLLTIANSSKPRP